MTHIIPSLLVQTQEEFERQVMAVQTSVDMLQIDIADGIFVPNITWRDPDITARLLHIDCELHLMVENPVAEMELWKDAPRVKRVFFHHDAVGPDEAGLVIKNLKTYGREIGMVLDPETPLEVIEPHAHTLDAVMFMGVHPGYQAQAYISETTERIKKAKQRYPNLFISLDGGVNMETLPEIMTSNPDAICPGSAIFHTGKSPAENTQEMKSLINSLTAP